MTDEQWSTIFHRALKKAGYSLGETETKEVYENVVKHISSQCLEYVISAPQNWNKEWYEIVKHEFTERTLLT